MDYLLYSVSAFLFVAVTVLYVARAQWTPILPDLAFRSRDYIYSRLPSSFAGDVEAGLSSDTFNLNGNIESGDGRAGLDSEAKAEILRIMKKRRLKFDAARKAYMENKFKANGIGADGRPRDPKFVSFS